MFTVSQMTILGPGDTSVPITTISILSKPLSWALQPAHLVHHHDASIHAASDVPSAAAQPPSGAPPGLEGMLARRDIPWIPGILASDATHPIGEAMEQHALMLDRALPGLDNVGDRRVVKPPPPVPI